MEWLSIKNFDRKVKQLVDLFSHGITRLFVLPFEDNEVRTGHAKYFLLAAEIKDSNVMTDGKNFLDQ